MRRATLKDAKFVWQLRNSTIKQSTNKIVIPFESHKKWFAYHYKEYKILDGIGFFRRDGNGFISIVIREEYRNKGLGFEILKNENGKAIILLENTRSFSVFSKSGFKVKGLYLEKNKKQ